MGADGNIVEQEQTQCIDTESTGNTPCLERCLPLFENENLIYCRDSYGTYYFDKTQEAGELVLLTNDIDQTIYKCNNGLIWSTPYGTFTSDIYGHNLVRITDSAGRDYFCSESSLYYVGRYDSFLYSYCFENGSFQIYDADVLRIFVYNDMVYYLSMIPPTEDQLLGDGDLIYPLSRLAYIDVNSGEPEFVSDLNIPCGDASQDGKYLYFTSYNELEPLDENRKLFRVNMESGQCELISSDYNYYNISAEDDRIAFWEFGIGCVPLHVLDLRDMSFTTFIINAIPSEIKWWKNDLLLFLNGATVGDDQVFGNYRISYTTGVIEYLFD